MKHVVITGASRGLGRAMAIGFPADGWTVSGCGTNLCHNGMALTVPGM